MNASLINSSLLFNHSSAGSSLPQNVFIECKESLGGFSFDFAVKVINVLVGYPANIMVMWLVSRKKSDSSTSDIFFFNLAIADICCCTMVPVGMFGILMLGIRNFNIFYDFAYGIKDSTPLFLTCICLDRYVAVVHPIVFTSIKDNKIRVAISMLVWAFTLPFAVSRSLSLESSSYIFAGLVLATFAIMVFCNISIMWSLKKSVFGKEKMHPIKKKALRTVVFGLAIIVFNYLPIVSASNFAVYFYFPEYCQFQHIAFMFMDISSSIEPLIYISKMEQLPCFYNLPCTCCRSQSTEPHHVST